MTERYDWIDPRTDFDPTTARISCRTSLLSWPDQSLGERGSCFRRLQEGSSPKSTTFSYGLSRRAPETCDLKFVRRSTHDGFAILCRTYNELKKSLDIRINERQEHNMSSVAAIPCISGCANPYYYDRMTLSYNSLPRAPLHHFGNVDMKMSHKEPTRE